MDAYGSLEIASRFRGRSGWPTMPSLATSNALLTTGMAEQPFAAIPQPAARNVLRVILPPITGLRTDAKITEFLHVP